MIEMVCIGSECLKDLPRSIKLEWLETNGLGGYAMGTASGANTRRYHGLLCAAVRPPVDRRMLLNKLEERLRIDGEVFELGCNIYGDTVHPQGHLLLSGFRLDPWPVWTYRMGQTVLEKSVLMPHGRNACIVLYSCTEGAGPVTLTLRPLFSWRDHHHLGAASIEFDLQCEQAECGAILTRGDDPPLVLEIGNGELWVEPDWYFGFTYPAEAERGLDFTEDLYAPASIEWTLTPGETVSLVASLNGPLEAAVDDICEAERSRRQALVARVPEADEAGRTLFRAADQFIVQRPLAETTARSIIAGYPWFTDWGRDTMIALPGLLLATGRHDEARDVLLAYGEEMQDGLIPNMFPDQTSGAAYNTVDATLWFFVAVRRYFDATGDLSVIRDNLYGRLKQALAAHIEGTHFGIRMDRDGLITAGDETTQLTWMDAKVGDCVFTPRHGKAVEINALWYSALRITEFFAGKLGNGNAAFRKMADNVKASFTETFWDEELGYLYDCVREDHIDASLRPNQIIALNLPYSVLTVAQERSVIRVVTEKLLTPYGLRTLSPSHPDYKGRYEGDQWARDGAYHQGTAWPWLLGSYLHAYLVHAGGTDEARLRIRRLIDPLVKHLQQAGLGSISEICDGDPPHEPRGCPAQAWSVGELLRVWVEYRLGEITIGH